MIYRNLSSLSDFQNDDNKHMIRTHISFYDNNKKNESISKEKEKDTFKKIIGMSVKHHKIKSIDFKTLFQEQKNILKQCLLNQIQKQNFFPISENNN
jgi:hypothetical protein